MGRTRREREDQCGQANEAACRRNARTEPFCHQSMGRGRGSVGARCHDRIGQGKRDLRTASGIRYPEASSPPVSPSDMPAFRALPPLTSQAPVVRSVQRAVQRALWFLSPEEPPEQVLITREDTCIHSRTPLVWIDEHQVLHIVLPFDLLDRLPFREGLEDERAFLIGKAVAEALRVQRQEDNHRGANLRAVATGVWASNARRFGPFASDLMGQADLFEEILITIGKNNERDTVRPWIEMLDRCRTLARTGRRDALERAKHQLRTSLSLARSHRS